ncbi:elongation factor P [Fulvitalea axinellae]|uniref:Elongation factor P n=1 Tax=Fulvitalea axinellae TaxID=1182444 RepID=A0AAU9CVV7_9BACT|nr:elongation factor P [Fulvitalea axinellae]
MATTADIRNGLCIEYNHGLYTIVEFQHVKPGKGPAFVRTKLKNLTTGKVIDNTFSAGHKIHPVRVERRKEQFLFKDDFGFNFMDTDTYEQFALPEAMVPNPDLIKDGDIVEVLFHAAEEKPLLVELPANVELKVVYTEPGLKGDTATNATKPAEVETGATIQVPLFINEGDTVKVDTKTRSYIERVKA